MTMHFHTYVHKSVDSFGLSCAVHITTFYKEERYLDRMTQLFESIAHSLQTQERPSVQGHTITHTGRDRCTKTVCLNLFLRSTSSETVEDFIFDFFSTKEESDPSVKFDASKCKQVPDYVDIGLENCCTFTEHCVLV